MPGPLTIDFKGLITAPGELIRHPASCVDVYNFRFPAPGLMRKREGFSRTPNGTGGPIWQVLNSKTLGANVFVHYGDSTKGVDIRKGDGTAAWTLVPSVDAGQPMTRSTNPRLRMAMAGPAHYLTGAEGLRRIESSLNKIRYAGMPRGRGPDCGQMDAAFFTVLNGAPGTLLPDGANVAYRMTWHRRDDSQNFELGGPPTGRTVVRNIAGTSGYAAAVTKNVTLHLAIPREFGTTGTALTTDYFWRLWRSRVTSTDTADDEMYLVAERFISAAEIAAGYALISDSTPDTFLLTAPRLHTNAVDFPPLEAGLRNGVLNADDPPPACVDAALFQDCLFVGNTQTRSSLFLTLIGALTVGDTFGVNGTYLTGVAAAPGALQFTVVNALPTLALNIEATARNLCDAICGNFGGSVEAFYISQGTQQPGQIYIEMRKFSVNYTFDCPARGANFRPDITAGVTSTPAVAPNALAFSKANRPDAMPPSNSLTVSHADSSILRIVPFRDKLFVFTDSGLYAVSGSSFSSFSVQLIDASLRLLVPDGVAVVDDAVYAWCVEGIAEIDEGGARIISTPIEPTIDRILNVYSSKADVQAYGFAVGYRLQHRVLFFFPSTSAGSIPDCAAWIEYDTRSQAWSSGKFPYTGVNFSKQDGRSGGVARYSDDRLVLVNWNPVSGDSYVFIERRTFTAADYIDTDRAGVDHVIASVATFRFGDPDAERKQHWQQVVLHFEKDVGMFNSSALYSLPSSLQLKFTTDTASSVLTLVPTKNFMACETPDQVRRAMRMQLQIQHTTSEACGVVGISYKLAEPATFAGT